MEKTLSIVKPDGVCKNIIGEVIKRYETVGLKVIGLRMLTLTSSDAEGFYDIHRERPFFSSLVAFMRSGPIVVMVLEGEGAIKKVRDLMGATNPAEADTDTIRKDFADSIEANIVHGSDGPATAASEIGFFFNALEISC